MCVDRSRTCGEAAIGPCPPDSVVRNDARVSGRKVKLVDIILIFLDMPDAKWSRAVLKMLDSLNKIDQQHQFYTFKIQDKEVGKILHPIITQKLQKFPEINIIDNQKLVTVDSATCLNQIVEILHKNEPDLIPGWRNEQYPIIYSQIPY